MRAALPRLAAFAVLLAFLLRPEWFRPLLQPLTDNGAPAIYNQGDLLALTLAHLSTVATAIGGASVAAIAMAVFVTRRAGAEFLPLARAIVTVGQTVPPVAVLALAVPVVGFGETPTLIALFLYGLLPVFENTLTGLTKLPADVIEAADAMGMTPARRLLTIELPLALPVILEGVRLSLVIGLATATIGSTIAAKGLGEVIIAGLSSNNLAFVVQGGLVVGGLAVLIYDAFAAIERALARRSELLVRRED